MQINVNADDIIIVLVIIVIIIIIIIIIVIITTCTLQEVLPTRMISAYLHAQSVGGHVAATVCFHGT